MSTSNNPTIPGGIPDNLAAGEVFINFADTPPTVYIGNGTRTLRAGPVFVGTGNPPGKPQTGVIFFNPVNKKTLIYDGAAWIEFGGGGGGNSIEMLAETDLQAGKPVVINVNGNVEAIQIFNQLSYQYQIATMGSTLPNHMVYMNDEMVVGRISNGTTFTLFRVTTTGWDLLHTLSLSYNPSMTYSKYDGYVYVGLSNGKRQYIRRLSVVNDQLVADPNAQPYFETLRNTGQWGIAVTNEIAVISTGGYLIVHDITKPLPTTSPVTPHSVTDLRLEYPTELPNANKVYVHYNESRDLFIFTGQEVSTKYAFSGSYDTTTATWTFYNIVDVTGPTGNDLQYSHWFEDSDFGIVDIGSDFVPFSIDAANNIVEGNALTPPQFNTFVEVPGDGVKALQPDGATDQMGYAAVTYVAPNLSIAPAAIVYDKATATTPQDIFATRTAVIYHPELGAILTLNSGRVSSFATDYTYGFFYSPSPASNFHDFFGYCQTDAVAGDTVKIDVWGALNAQQTGLIRGEKYYIAFDGTLTNQDTGVPAGVGVTDKAIYFNYDP